MNDGLLPLFYNPNIRVLRQVAGALVAGGCRILEFTNRGDFAIQAFSELVQHCATEYPDIIIGVGTIEDAPTAALYIAHGANFIVAPNFNPEVARLCNRRKIPYIPGCGSVSEISNAEELGAEIIKLFPADALGGPAFVKALLGPRPWTRIMPTGSMSVEEANLRAWFDAGVACVGAGSSLIRPEWLKNNDFGALQKHVAATLERIRMIRGK